mmetsp:Transcript_26727/g.53268  ORF Transcript_26727/g.53268 Transcript_26727/m.53268 type:complete len:407 (-) Transcript_26727:16-1236(-)
MDTALLTTFPLHPSTPSGLPQLPSTHTLILTLPDSEIRFVPQSSSGQIRLALKTLWLTSRSLIFLPRDQQNLRHVPLNHVVPGTIQTYTSFLGRNPKVKFSVTPMPPVEFVKGGVKTSLQHLRFGQDEEGGGEANHIVFRAENAKELYEKVEVAVRRQEWKDEEEKPEASKKAFTASSAGIAGIIRKKKETQVKAQTTINSTFDGDLESLLRNARDVISMVEKYKAKLARSGEKDEGDMDEVLSTMGLPTLTTRETAGKAYDAQLSQEIYDYSLQRLKERKVIQLADLYITYSRARGADLVGPDEFHKAVMAAEKGRGMKVREFKGVKCVVGSDFSPAAVSKAVEAAAGDAGADAMELAKTMNINSVLARCLAEEVEAEGRVVRDEGGGGVVWYRDKFEDWSKELC